MTKALTQQQFIDKATELHNNNYSYDKTIYIRSSDKVCITCPLHGDFTVTANNHISKSNLCGCPQCGGTKKVGVLEFIHRANEIHHSKYDYTKIDFKDTQQHITIICPQHGEFTQTPTRHMAGRGCQQCGGTKVINMPSAIEKALIAHGGVYNYDLIPKTARYTEKVPIICKKHNVFFISMKYHVNRLWGCPKCSCRISIPEGEVATFLSQYTQVERGNRQLIPPKEIDIWLPEFNIGVEFHGLYHHTTNSVGYQHRQKWEMAQEKGVRLVQIFSDEWANKQDIVKNRLLAFIGKVPKYHARKLEHCIPSPAETKEFLNTIHIQGMGTRGLNYGLQDINGDLIALATFGKKRSGAMVGVKESDTWEVLRYASIGRVHGGFSKIWKRFLKDINPNKVISYCDLRYGTGRLYEVSGFNLESVTEPDYWWVTKNKKERLSRYSVQKHKLADIKHPLHKFYSIDKTEVQICTEAGLEKIHGVGSQKWVWTK